MAVVAVDKSLDAFDAKKKLRYHTVRAKSGNCGLHDGALGWIGRSCPARNSASEAVSVHGSFGRSIVNVLSSGSQSRIISNSCWRMSVRSSNRISHHENPAASIIPRAFEVLCRNRSPIPGMRDGGGFGNLSVFMALFSGQIPQNDCRCATGVGQKPDFQQVVHQW